MAGNNKQREMPGAMIKAVREAGGTSQREMAHLMGVNRVTWYKYEKNGAPRWMRYALAGYALAHADCIPSALRVHVKKLDEAERVEQEDLPGVS